jgi:hypothetical protein
MTLIKSHSMADLTNILLQLVNSSNSNETIKQLVIKNKFNLVEDILNDIESTREKKDDERLELLLNIASRDGLNNKYTKVLCSLIIEEWHFSQEDIAMMLEEIKDNSSVGCLYAAAIKIPNFDDGRSLAKKCMWALEAINTDDAKHKLLLLSKHEDTIVREFALERL